MIPIQMEKWNLLSKLSSRRSTNMQRNYPEWEKTPLSEESNRECCLLSFQSLKEKQLRNSEKKGKKQEFYWDWLIRSIECVCIRWEKSVQSAIAVRPSIVRANREDWIANMRCVSIVAIIFYWSWNTLLPEVWWVNL